MRTALLSSFARGPRVLLVPLLAGHLILLNFYQRIDFDTWFHLKAGELYVTTRSLPSQDPFAFTTVGREWIKYSWLADVLFYLTVRAAGVPGLVLLRLLVLCLVAWALYRILRACGLHPLAALLLVFVASLVVRFRILIRPELWTLLLLLGTLAILLWLPAGPRWAAYALLPLQVVWINVHASFVFGIGLPGLVLVANLLKGSRLEPGWGRLRLDPPRLRHLAMAVALLPAAGLLNPQGTALLLFPFRQNSMHRLTRFDEWKPVWSLPGIYPRMWEVVIILSLLLLGFAVIALLLWALERRCDPVGWGIVLSMGTYALLRNRGVPYFVLAVLPLLALALVRLAGHLLSEADQAPRRWLAQDPARARRSWENTGVVACLLLLITSILAQTLPARPFPGVSGVGAGEFPEGASRFLERQRLDGRIFNTYEFGGYLLWRRWPANQVFIDGRYDGILFDPAVLEAYAQAHRSPAALDRITAAYGIDILVLDATPHASRPRHLERHPGWARVYWDMVAEVFVRRGGRYAALVAAHEYRLTRPEPDLSYLAAYRRDPETWRRALGELRRVVAENPETTLAWLGLAQEYHAAGPAALGDRLEALTRAAALVPDPPLAGGLHAYRAEAFFQLGRLDEAASTAREALRLDGTLLKPRWILASVAERRGALPEARAELRTLLTRLAPGHPEAPRIRERLEGVERAIRTMRDR